ncbi:MAG: tripartite tricarboxylate transporter substrate binding protein [Burkholderiales bacterium]|jgi:tripartite-type tricarboxylate transporter receptor subunit TctC|nr:tripartite tricarboxylate transporter substrate binding protein [Burkholderiales bacterium]
MEKVCRSQGGRAALLASLALSIAAHAPALSAQTSAARWPDRPIRVVAAAPPGSPSDIVSRVIGMKLSEDLGQQFIIDNRGGAGGTVASGIIARANPDGYTVGVVSGSYTATPALQKLQYDPVKSITPVGMIADGPMVLAVHPSTRASTLKELISLARTKPGAIAVGSTGSGSLAHLAMEFMQQQTKTSMVHVPFAGAFLAVNGLLGGEVQAVFVSPGPLLPHIKAGKLRALAVTSEQRWNVMPDVPAMSEQLPGFAASVWFGMLAPAGTPRAIVGRLNAAIGRALKDVDVQERLRAIGLEPTAMAPEDFGRLIERDIAMWDKVVRTGNLKVEQP